MVVVSAVVLVGAACGRASGPSPTVRYESANITTEGGTTMELSSPAFDQGARIPAPFTCDADDVSPELKIDGIPPATATLVLIMDDPDAPMGTWDHWVAYDIEPAMTIPQNVGALGTDGLNSWKRTGYGGPCPPSGTHRYIFQVLALDVTLGLAEGANKEAVLAATEGHVLAGATLMGTYAR